MDDMTRTHCPYCSLQCGMTLQTTGRTGLEVQPWAEFPVNEGGLCRKGWTAAELRGQPRAAHHPAGQGPRHR